MHLAPGDPCTPTRNGIPEREGSNHGLNAEWLEHSRQLHSKLDELRARVETLCRAADELSGGRASPRAIGSERQEHYARLRQGARESCEHARQLRLKSKRLYASVAKWLEEARELRRGPGSR
jgi:hypothetical protein